MKKMIAVFLVLLSTSSFSNCLIHIEGMRYQPINILATSDYSNCSDDELRHITGVIDRFATERISKLKKEVKKSDSGDEQFRLMTEINGAKVSLSLIKQEVLNRE